MSSSAPKNLSESVRANQAGVLTSPTAPVLNTQRQEKAVIKSGDVTSGYTVALLNADGTESAKQYENVRTFPGGTVLLSGRRVLLLFETAEAQPEILVLGGSAGMGGMGAGIANRFFSA